MKRLIIVMAIALVAAMGLVTPTAHADTPPGFSHPLPILTPADAPQASGGQLTTTSGTVDAANTFAQRTYPTGKTYLNVFARLVPAQDPSSMYYFNANQVYLNNGDTNGGYSGLQTHLITNGVDQGPGMIASMWGATGAQPGAGCTAISGSEVGDTFWSIHCPIPWYTTHTYTYQAQDNYAGSGRVSFWINDNTTNTLYSLGTILIPTSWGTFQNSDIQWTEEYANNFAQCSDIVPSRNTWNGDNTYMKVSGSFNPPFWPTAAMTYISSGTGICTNSISVWAGNCNHGSYSCDNLQAVGSTS